MSQPSSGLRFDIYERVHLPDSTAGVKEINAIELSPEISIAARGDQAVLKGHLTLSGTYTGEDETRGEEERLAHRIPVEITLPLSRIADVEDIRVEIENFDVDVLSPRSLNVTGVLSLGGIEMSASADPAWRAEEEAVFTHRVEPSAAADEEPPQTGREEAAEAQPVQEANEANETLPAQEANEAWQANEAQEAAGMLPLQEWQAAEANDAQWEEREKREQAAAQEAPGIKIAFSGKPETAEETEPIGASGLMALTGVTGAAGAADVAEAAVASGAAGAADATGAIGAIGAAGADAGGPAAEGPAEPAKRQPPPQPPLQPPPQPPLQPPPQASAAPETPAAEPENRDRVEWKRLFLQSEEAPSFRRLRMCIAQKEDTIETIAERYNKNARELMLHNRLNEQYLQEGQVVYIP